ncbi:hypothetical protein SDC9_133218 [bioreactor metagenome]|uniref:Uncharacterized protein n=1 Tax=bioreactor metagenome TaxID=1076179 RepID=A0A645DA82_9ZZZZ
MEDGGQPQNRQKKQHAFEKVCHPRGLDKVQQLVQDDGHEQDIQNIRNLNRQQVPDDLAQQDREPCAHSCISFLPGSERHPSGGVSRKGSPQLQECLYYIKNSRRLQGKQRQNS